MNSLNDWARYYYLGVLIHGHNPKHFWFERKRCFLEGVVFQSGDGYKYTFFYSDPKDRLGRWKCWIPMILFLKDERTLNDDSNSSDL